MITRLRVLGFPPLLHKGLTDISVSLTRGENISSTLRDGNLIISFRSMRPDSLTKHLVYLINAEEKDRAQFDELTLKIVDPLLRKHLRCMGYDEIADAMSKLPVAQFHTEMKRVNDEYMRRLCRLGGM